MKDLRQSIRVNLREFLTESKSQRLYNAFKGWMDSEISSGFYEWRKNKDGDIILVDTNKGYGHMLLIKKSKELWVYHDLFTEIQSYFPLEKSDLLELIGRYVGNTFQMEGINTRTRFWAEHSGRYNTFPID